MVLPLEMELLPIFKPVFLEELCMVVVFGAVTAWALEMEPEKPETEDAETAEALLTDAPCWTATFAEAFPTFKEETEAPLAIVTDTGAFTFKALTVPPTVKERSFATLPSTVREL